MGLTEKNKKTRMEEDMEHLVQSIGDNNMKVFLGVPFALLHKCTWGIWKRPQALVPGCPQCCLVFGVYLGVFGSSKTSVNVETRLCLEKLKMLPRSSLSTITMPSE